MTHRAPALIGALCLFACASPGADFRVDSNLVLIPVSVTDSRNHAITGLDRGAFRIFDDKAEQTLVQFAREDVPLSVGIVLDLSGSMRDKLQKAREGVDQFLRCANPEDEFFLVEFSSRAQLTVPFTTDAAAVRDRLRQAEPHGKTALLDAINLAMDSMKGARNPRRALVILSDGGDNDSRYTRTEMLNRVREADLWIYSMGIYDRVTSSLPEETRPARELLEALSEQSGGRHFAVGSPAELPEVAGRIGLELHNQYILGYRPSGARRDGKYHRVQVKIAEGRRLTVSWRPGYYGR
jgi:Ca-activated chloride channel family protein